jgi:hypothetical protein
MKFIVQSAAAKMPSSCKGRYRRVAVLLVDDLHTNGVKMISSRAKGVIKVIATWEKLNCGTTSRCAFSRAMDEARSMCDRLNKRDEALKDWWKGYR